MGKRLSEEVEVDEGTRLTTTFRYDPNENPTLVTKPAGNQVRTLYDERDLPYEMTEGFGTPLAATTRIDYDGNGNKVRLVDAEDNNQDGAPEATVLRYDGIDRLVETIDPLGNRSVSEFDVAGNEVRRAHYGHPAGAPGTTPVLLSESRTAFDELSRPIRTEVTRFLAPGFDPTRAVEFQAGVVATTFEYDALGRRTFEVEDDGQASETVYDGAGRAIETIDALGNRTVVAYNRGSSPIAVTTYERSSGGAVPERSFATRYVYDPLDRAVRATDNAGQTVRMEYDSQDRVVLRSDAVGAPVADPLGLFPGDINQPGNTKRFVYDGLGRLRVELTDLRLGGTGGGAIDQTSTLNRVPLPEIPAHVTA